MTTKCIGKDRNDNPCRNKGIQDTKCCKIHQYMKDYTDDMLNNLSKCSGCKKQYYLIDGVKTCENCKQRGKSSKEKQKETKVLCKAENCTFKKSDENDYCMKHQINLFIDETHALGKKMCKNYVRGCRTQLENDYSKSSCESCLEKDRERDRKRRGGGKATMELDDTHQFCGSCCKTRSKDMFEGEKGSTKTCSVCRERNKLQDEKRDKEHRNAVARIAEQKPVRKEKKQEWKENNYEKVALTTMNYRQRQIENDMDGYLKKNAENAKQWRENNPEKVVDNNENKKNSKQLQYAVYSRTARDKRLDFDLSFSDFNNIVSEPCYYCDIIQDKGFNGIDRKDSTIGYTLDNCVSSCTMCNFMKGSYGVDYFYHKIEHILTYNGIIKGNYCYDVFSDHKGSSYTTYQTRAIRKQLDFLITKPEFDMLIHNDCYICGKKTIDGHVNGVDRIENNEGYTLNNVNSCCGECNYMKKSYDLEKFMDKLYKIYNKHNLQKINDDKKEQNRINQQTYRERQIEEIGIDALRKKKTEQKRKERSGTDNTIVKNKNKKTPEELREIARLKKQRHRQALREKYGDEEFKQKRAKELAEYRAKIKQDKMDIN